MTPPSPSVLQGLGSASMGNKLFRASLIFGCLMTIGFIAFFGYYVLFLKLIVVPTGAMANTIIPGDHLVVKKRAFGPMKRGDVIIFKYPRDTSFLYVFRVVGLPSELIEVRGRSVYINGEELPEHRVIVKPESRMKSLLEESSSEGSGSYKVFYVEGADSVSQAESDTQHGVGSPLRVPDKNYFVMGDNRDNSHDSRFWGPVPQSLIVGKPTMIYWSSHADESGVQRIRWERFFTKLK